MILFAEIGEVSIGNPFASRSALLVERLDLNQPISICKRQWSNYNSPDNAEDRGVCADCQRERQHRGKSKPRVLTHHPEPKQEVATEVLQPGQPPCLSCNLFDHVEIPHFPARGDCGHIWRCAPFDVTPYSHLQMVVDLFI